MDASTERKRFKRVLLVVPGYPESHYFERPLLAGLGYISQALSDQAVDNAVVDLRFDSSLRVLERAIAEYQPDLVGLSVMTFKYMHTYNAIRWIKRKWPAVQVVVGGPHVSTWRARVLQECEGIDFGVTLEGEQTLVELCEGGESASIKGLLYRDEGGHVRYTGDRPFVTDLDSVSFPRYVQFDLGRYERFIPLVSSRGCPYGCSYCPVHLAIGRQFRCRSAASIVDEIEYWWGRGYRSFGFADDNFTLRPERVLEFCDLLEGRSLSGLRLSCSNGVRADRVSRQLLTRMRQVGFYQLSFGVEAGNDDVLMNIRKGESIGVIKRAIGDACDLGYEVGLFFLLGSPGEKQGDVLDSVNLALSYPVTYARFYNLIPFPGTDLYRWADANGYLLERPEAYLNDASHFVNEPIFETPEMPRAERRRLWKYANRVVGEHCRRNQRRFVKAKIEAALSAPGWLAEPLARLWCFGFVQSKVLSIGAVRRARAAIMRA